jgi:hypothetical protein
MSDILISETELRMIQECYSFVENRPHLRLNSDGVKLRKLQTEIATALLVVVPVVLTKSDGSEMSAEVSFDITDYSRW